MWSKGEPEDARDVAVMATAAPVELTSRQVPSSVNITSSSRVHVGPKFVSITQNVENTELVKGRILGLELVSPTKSTRLRCSVAVFVCWAFIVALGLGVYLFQLDIQRTRLDIGLNETWYLRRGDWQAMDQYGLDLLDLPVKNVVIGHTGADYCNQKYVCIQRMLETQQDNLRRGFLDIVPNFLVGGNGTVFEGRGANIQAAMIRSWNAKSITIMFIGDYRHVDPDELQFKHVNVLLRQLVKEGVLQADFQLFGQCQLSHDTYTPGYRLLDRLRELMHWNPVDKNRCLRK